MTTTQISLTDAREVQRLSLEAVTALNSAVELIHGSASPELADRLKKGLGLSIGKIVTDVLVPIYDIYPQLDHLKGTP